MKSLRVGSDFYINAASIEIVQPYPTRPALRERKAAIADGCYFDATGGARILSLIVLKSGWVVASASSPATLIKRPLVAAPTRTAASRESRKVSRRHESRVLPSPSSNRRVQDAPRHQNSQDTSTPPRRGLFRRKS